MTHTPTPWAISDHTGKNSQGLDQIGLQGLP
jgi:hypothetical protein